MGEPPERDDAAASPAAGFEESDPDQFWQGRRRGVFERMLGKRLLQLQRAVKSLLKEAGGDPLDVATEQWISLLRHHDPLVRAAAAREFGCPWLERFCRITSFEILLHDDESEDPQYLIGVPVQDCTLVVNALRTLIKENQDHDMILGAIVSLGRLGRAAPPGTKDLVVRTLCELVKSNRDRDVTTAAIEELRGFGLDAARDAVPLLIKRIEGEDTDSELKVVAITALSSFGPDAASDAVPALIGALDSKKAKIRLAACRALAWLGGQASEAEDAVDALVRRVNEDTDPEVQKEATIALLKIDPEGEHIVESIKDSLLQDQFLNALRGLGSRSRALRERLKNRWTNQRKNESEADGTTDRPGERTRADSKTDKEKKRRNEIPENNKVMQLIRLLKAQNRESKRTGEKWTQLEVAKTLTNDNKKQAQNLLRQVRRFPNLRH